MAGTLPPADPAPTHSDTPAQIVSDPKPANPRAEIDTSPPFGSVKEAVTRFGGSGSWIPLHILRLAGHDFEEFDMDRVEKQAAELENELNVKERETLEVLRELESSKAIIEALKASLMREVSAFMTSLDVSSDSGTSTPHDKSTSSLTLTELKEAKSNLTKTTTDLAMIRASVESLTKKTKTHKAMVLGNTDGRLNTPTGDKDGETKRVIEESVGFSSGFTFERMEAAAQYEVIKATSEIEHTKVSIKMVEMRLVAAKKMEEAARAMEAVARAERNGGESVVREGITLSYEEYSSLARKARKGEEFSERNGVVDDLLCHQKDADLSTMTFLKDSEETNDDAKRGRKTLEEALGPRIDDGRRDLASGNRFFQEKPEDVQTRKSTHRYPKTTNSHPFRGQRGFGPLAANESNDSRPVLRSSVSIGDILSRKLTLQDDVTAESQARRAADVSLSQMLREQSGLIFHESRKSDKEQRKKFGFIHVSLPLNRKSKSRPQPLNMRQP